MKKIKIGFLILTLLVVSSLLFMGKGEINTDFSLSLPSLSHPFGFDSLGRDLLERGSYALLVSLSIGLISTSLSLFFAIILLEMRRRGSFLGYLSSSFSRSIKTIPSLVLALFFYSIGLKGGMMVIITLALSSSCSLSLFMYPLVEKTEKEEYILAAKALGLRNTTIYFKYIMPSIWPYLREELSSSIIYNILTESSLSFLCVGLDSSIPTLGRILADGRVVILTYPHVVLFPSLLLVLLVSSIMLINRGFSELNSSLY